MLTPEQLELRRTRLGASELIDVLLDTYRLFQRKMTGRSDVTGNEPHIRHGNHFELPTARCYADMRADAGEAVRLLVTARRVENHIEPVTLIDPERSWFCGTPDFLPAREHADSPVSFVPDIEDIWRLRDAGLLDRGLEVKTGEKIAERHLMADDLWGEPGTDQMPRRYLAQCVGYLALTGLDRWDLVRLRLGGDDARRIIVYTVRRDPEIEGLLLDAGARFVRDHLLTGRAPKPTDMETAEAELERIFPRDNGQLRQATGTDLLLLEEYRDAVVACERAGVRRQLLELLVKARIGDDRGLDATADGLGRVGWRLRQGKRTVSAQRAVRALCARLEGRVPAAELEALARAALASATRQGEPYRQVSRPHAWTAGVEEQVRAELQDGGMDPLALTAARTEGDEDDATE